MLAICFKMRGHLHSFEDLGFLSFVLFHLQLQPLQSTKWLCGIYLISTLFCLSPTYSWIFPLVKCFSDYLIPNYILFFLHIHLLPTIYFNKSDSISIDSCNSLQVQQVRTKSGASLCHNTISNSFKVLFRPKKGCKEGRFLQQSLLHLTHFH